MKAFTTVGAVLGAVGMLLSPQVMALLSGTQVFWLLTVALVLALMGESIIPAIKRPPSQQPDSHDEPPINDQ